MTGKSGNFASLWYSGKSYQKHVEKRIAKGDIKDENDYKLKTFEAISKSKNMVVAVSKGDMISGKLQIGSDGWVVLIGIDGKIVTSYPFDSEKVTFSERHKQMGDTVYEYTINPEIKKLLNRVFIAS